MRSTLACLTLAAILGALPALAPAAEDKPICANCHEQPHESIAATAHGAKNDANGSMCQACHGDAAAHLLDPVKSKPANMAVLKKGTAAEKSAICMNCHAGSRHLAFWESGKHARNDVACSNCHNIHGKTQAPKAAPFTTTSRPIEAEVCGNCHKQVRNATMKPSHHPILEGKVKCSDCHNPHGALSPSMVKHETINQQCFSCHADKRGPYVFGHPPVEENCITCHTPHGSSHGKLLNEKVPNLCQDCHVQGRHPTAYYGQNQAFLLPNGAPNTAAGTSSRFVARACLNCHNAIHGSNAPSNRGKFLLH
jgi:DmsE family decaheme c-type cytochrome